MICGYYAVNFNNGCPEIFYNCQSLILIYHHKVCLSKPEYFFLAALGIIFHFLQ